MHKRMMIMLVTLGTSLLSENPTPLHSGMPAAFEPHISFVNTNPELAQRIETTIPLAVRMLDTAIATLEQGLGGMSAEEHQLFLQFYDPGSTGEINEDFVRQALENFRIIRSGFDRQLTLVFDLEGWNCTGMQLYHTNFLIIYICPFIAKEPNPERLARDLVHEVAHMSLLVFDRAYFSTTDSRYLSLTPRGHWAAELPLFGSILREIARNDTLYHPDAYSRFAWAVSKMSRDGIQRNLLVVPHNDNPSPNAQTY